MLALIGLTFPRSRAWGDHPAAARRPPSRGHLLGENHSDVGLALYNFGNTLNEQRRFAEAEQMLRECLAIYRNTLPEQHVQIAWALNDLANVLCNDQSRYGEAERLYRDAITMFEGLSLDPTNAAGSWDGLGYVFYKQGQLNEAEKYYRIALDLRKKNLGPVHVSNAYSETELGRLLSERGRSEEAERLLRNALDLYSSAYPGGHWLVGEAEALLGSCLGTERRFDEAEPLLLKGYSTLRAKRGEGDEDTRDAASHLVALYEAWGKPDKAAEWRGRQEKTNRVSDRSPR